MKNMSLFALVFVLVILIGCTGPMGPTGATGATGSAGPVGTTLIKTYTGTMTGNNTQTISVPEIQGKIGTTFVLAYSVYSSTNSQWSPISDGWSNADIMQVWISWTNGTVTIYLGTAGYAYMINVYQTN